MSNLRDFTRLKQVGKGAFGTAWLVESRNNFKKYVIKELGHKEMSERERVEARKEVMLLSKMNHPNIVSYYNSFEEGGRVHILMEYCENGDLGARIKLQNGTLFKEDQILDYFVQICLGIKHIHDSKILHRDIKPQNIFLTKNNVVKLGDFGIAKLMNSTTAFTSTTVGTPFYFSPELCSRRMYNNKSDIWSLGCVLYELCTLNHAFSAQEMAILALRIKNVSYKPISVNYSTGLRFLISSIFQRDPRERPNINEILKKPFISRILDKNCPQNTPRPVPVKDISPRRPPSATPIRVNSGLQNRKIINKENLLANSPYLPPSKKQMIKKQENNRAQALIIKKNEIIKKGRAAMIINDRENAWKIVLSSPDDSKEDNLQEEIVNDQKERPIRSPGMYDNYYADLERLKQQQELREIEGKQLMHKFNIISDDDMAEGVYRKIDPVKNNIQLGVNAADRDKLVQEYLANKQKAAINKNRNGAGVALALCGARKIEQKCVPPATPLNHEEEMSDRLNKIRQQNVIDRKNQNIGDFNLNFDKDKGLIINKENARIALEDLQKRIKQRSDELQHKLALKRQEKEKDIDNGYQRKEDQNIKLINDAQRKQNNVVLFPKRADPFVPNVNVNIEVNKPHDPRMTNILEQIKNVKNSEDEKDIELDKIKDHEMTNILNQINCFRDKKDKEDNKLPSLSVVLNKLRKEPSTARPTTAPAAEKIEIKKIKTDILKRLNSNKVLLDKVEENPHRKSWALNFDDNLILKDEKSDNLDETLSDTNTMADVSRLTDNEEVSPRQKWQTDLNQPTNLARQPEPSKHIWTQNEDFPLNFKIEEDNESMRVEDSEKTIKLDNIVENQNTITESTLKSDNLLEEIDEILSVIASVSNDTDREPSEHIVKTDAWEKKENQKNEVPFQIIKEEKNEKLSSSSSSEDDRNEVSMQMRKVLEIKSSSSSEEDVSKYNIVDEEKEILENLSKRVTEARSLPNLYRTQDMFLSKAKSEGDLTKTVTDEDFCDHIDDDDDNDEENEDFSDQKSDDENIFFKIEMIRHKLETEIGLDPLIDAMEFVRESQDLDGDDIATKLREMLNNNEDAVNSIFHLVVLEEQYNNMD